ncbi:CytB-hydogenase: Ni/Fe-hydrogenase, b-type cytochrome subunit [Tepidimonas alkaliphilus]|uniref:CytB-hydogenase: Ni/Fe-hydrogenase, b-type cytochrome subunit n=1 Tax=Tepidimonas alkaliphilus TaxID=2588942 RepID=A0A554W732_9BURK|nr:cytochrome b/b6 domain-containing protein [Tepidimonas alkaliphilus]TSE19388.1 CytB-hydogenase: Ni/Fe-hydrogenase, b-type cytochrome subunit [Tepidimonas alkaliphilus]
MTQAQTEAVRVWDLPTRLFHWLLAASVAGLVITGNLGGNWMTWHQRLGYAVLALLLFRLFWGLWGGRWSRFGSFLYSPATLWAYLRGRAPAEVSIGHSPLGALSVWALLLALAVQVGTGLISDDEIAFVGPLARYVESSTAYAATAWHKSTGKLIVLALVGLHVAAIGVYHWRGQALLPPMLHGDKRLPVGTPASADGARERWRAVALALLSAMLTWAIVQAELWLG